MPTSRRRSRPEPTELAAGDTAPGVCLRGLPLRAARPRRAARADQARRSPAPLPTVRSADADAGGGSSTTARRCGRSSPGAGGRPGRPFAPPRSALRVIARQLPAVVVVDGAAPPPEPRAWTNSLPRSPDGLRPFIRTRATASGRLPPCARGRSAVMSGAGHGPPAIGRSVVVLGHAPVKADVLAHGPQPGVATRRPRAPAGFSASPCRRPRPGLGRSALRRRLRPGTPRPAPCPPGQAAASWPGSRPRLR